MALVAGVGGGYLAGGHGVRPAQRAAPPAPPDDSSAFALPEPMPPMAPSGLNPSPLSRPRDERSGQALPAPRVSGLDDATAAAPALPDRQISGLEERDAHVARLRASGPDTQNRLEPAEAVGAAWSALAEKAKIDAKVGPWECHRAGCFSGVVHASGSTVDDLTTEIAHSDEFRGWEGPKIRSAPIDRADGRVEVTWFLLSPNEAAGPPGSHAQNP